MRKLSEAGRKRTQAVIDRNRNLLMSVPNVIAAEPGFPVVKGKLLREPAIILYVSQKLSEPRLLPEELAPETVEGIRVDVVQASPVMQLMADPASRELATEIETAAARHDRI